MKNTIVSMAIAIAIILLSYKLANSMEGCPTENKRIAIQATFEDVEIGLTMAITEGVERLKAMGYEKIELIAYAVDIENKVLIVVLEGKVEREVKNEATKSQLSQLSLPL